MSNKRCAGQPKEVGNEACDTHLFGKCANSLSMNRQMLTKAIEQSATSSWHPAHESPTLSSLAHGNSSFINGDLIDLCDQINDHEQSNESSRDLCEAINSQLLADMCVRSPPARDCHVLYPTKVSFYNNQISESKLNHTNKLNNSVDLSNSVATLSADAVGKCSESNTNEQHQTVIREFKRIGTYCTLRPEQRRKHLLKVLPTLRNSMLLQTLLASNGTAKHLSKINSSVIDPPLIANNDIDSLLIDLDDFIIDGNTARMQRMRSSNDTGLDSNESFTSDCDIRNQRSSFALSRYSDANSSAELNKNCIKIDPDKVEDCLLELDAYLEEIDRDYVLACAANGPVTSSSQASSSTAAATTTIPPESAVAGHSAAAPFNNNAKSMQISANVTNDCLKKTTKNHIQRLFSMDDFLDDACIGGPSLQNDHLIDDCITTAAQVTDASNIRKQIRNSDIRMNQCDDEEKSFGTTEINGSRNTDNKRKSNDICNNHQPHPLKRGHKLRNTVAGSGRRTIVAKSTAPSQSVDNSPKKMLAKNMALSWRRLSMRKTCPIDLPEQRLSKDATQYETQPASIGRTPSSTNRSNEFTMPANSNHSSSTNSDAHQEDHCFDETITSSSSLATTTSSNAYLLSHNENNDLSSNSDGATVLSSDSNNQLPELSSLNNEFLNTILATPNYQQHTIANNSTTNSSQNETNFVHNLDEDSDCTTATFEKSRPRQLGRRSEMRSRIVSITAERNAEGNQRIIVNCDRDNVQCATQPSCSSLTNPSSLSSQPQPTLQRLSNQCQFTASEASSGASSRNPSPVSIASSTESSSGGSTSAGETDTRPTPHRTMNMSGDTEQVASNRSTGSTAQRQMNSKTTVWPFGISRVFAATCCTLGLFNISRFSIFSIIFGANFIVQFLLLSLFLGIPFLWLQMCLGANIKGGPSSMWRVSPICRGIGIALVLVQALMTIYSAVAIAWMLVYLRDSVVSARYPWYRWQ